MILFFMWWLGLDWLRTKSKSIYRLLDWRKPGKAIVVSLACIFSVFIVHLLVYCLYRCRVFIFKQFCMRERTFHQYARGDQIIIQNNQASKIARTPSSYDESKSDQFFNPSTVVELKWTGNLYHVKDFNYYCVWYVDDVAFGSHDKMKKKPIYKSDKQQKTKHFNLNKKKMRKTS